MKFRTGAALGYGVIQTLRKLFFSGFTSLSLQSFPSTCSVPSSLATKITEHLLREVKVTQVQNETHRPYSK
jgi:hypothetical protein